MSRPTSLMQVTLEAIADGILVTDAAGRIEIVNQKFLEIWALTRDEVEGTDHAALVLRLAPLVHDAQGTASRLDDIQASAVDSLDEIELAGGRWVERFSRPLLIDGDNVGRVWTYRDATARRRAEAALRDEAASECSARADTERASRLKDEFLSLLSHELRTPLSAILGWSKALLLGRSDPASVERGLQAIARNATAQARLIDDVFDINRLVSGQIRLERQRFDPAEVVAAAVAAARPSVEAKGIRLTERLTPMPGAVSGERVRLQQIVANLLSNAVKFTPRDGWIEVELRRVDAQVEIVVRDGGFGVEAALLPRLFDRFRETGAAAPAGQGLGLGLPIAWQLVALHGGSIHATSEGPGRGATFVVSLPLDAGDRPITDAAAT